MKKVIVIGGGFAGLSVAKALKKEKDLEILLLDRTNHHLFQPLLYQVATASLPVSNVAYPLREIFQHQLNVTVLMEDVQEIILEKQCLQTVDGKTFSYDFLVVATGTKHSYFGRDQWENDAPGLKTLLDASLIHEKLLMAFEQAERAENRVDAKRFLNFAIIGGGPTGVELAGSIAEFAHFTLIKNFRNIKPEDSKIYLVEGEKQILPSYPQELAKAALKDLELLGVTVLLNTRVTNISSQGFYVGDNFFEAPTIIWAAGNQASPLLKSLNQTLDLQGRVMIQSDLSLPNYPNVFVIGDAAAVKDKQGKILPAIAPVAIQEGRYVAKIIKNKTVFEKRKPFIYFDKGMIATIGRGRAVALLRKLKFSGFLAWWIWCFIHIFYLVSFKNRFLVMIQWAYLYLTGSRPDRIIRNPIDE